VSGLDRGKRMANITQKGRVLELNTTLGKDHFLIHKLEVEEGISQLFSIQAEVLVEEGKEK
jgi:hypothetical protein